MSFTLAQLFLKIAVQETFEIVDMVGDPIDYISKVNTENVDADTYELYNEEDNSSVGTVDAYGNAPSSSKANTTDRSLVSHQITFPAEKQLEFDILEGKFSDYGINYDIFQVPGGVFESNKVAELYSNNGKRNSVQKEVGRLVNQMYLVERAEVETALDTIDTSTSTLLKPYGLQIIGDAADRPNNWNFDNKGTAAHDATELESCQDRMQKQKYFTGSPVGNQQIMILLHSAKESVVAKTFMPDKVTNTLNRSIVDLRGMAIPKMVGTWTSSYTKHWIAISNRAITNKSFKRVYSTKLAAVVSSNSVYRDGYLISIIPNQNEKKITLRIQSKSMFIFVSPVGIDKSVPAN